MQGIYKVPKHQRNMDCTKQDKPSADEKHEQILLMLNDIYGTIYEMREDIARLQLATGVRKCQ